MFLVVAVVVVSSYLGKKIHRSHNDEANQLRLWPGFLEEDNEVKSGLKFLKNVYLC